MTPTDGTLYHAFAQIPDHRKARGRSYGLASLLTLAATALLCGARSVYAIAQWGHDYNHLAPLLGFTKPRLRGRPGYRTPCVGELHAVFTALDVARFEAVLTAWVRAAGYDDLDERLPHLDGKALRGSRGHQLPGVHLLAAYSGELRAVVAQLAVADTDEHKAALGLLKLLPLGGVVLTADAAFTQRDLCQQVIDGGGHYLLPVKDNQPALKADIAAGFDRAFPPAERAERRAVDRVAETRGKGHGRVERRRIRATTRLNDYLGWPGVRQVCVVERSRRVNGAEERESAFYITSLPRSEASATRLLRLIRAHWSIESQVHYVRDVSAGEDACRVRTANAPGVLAGMRNAALTVLRARGESNIAAAFRHLAAVPAKAVELVTRFVLRLL
jgi:predicted transposase YbfD/YdcC